MKPIESIPLEAIQAAQRRLRGKIVRTPLIPLVSDDAPAEIYLKLENLQPIGSFKIRGSGNAMAMADPEALRQGVYTASAGNMAQGVAWNAQRMGVPCSVIVPDTAPDTKLEAVERMGATAIPLPFDDWWRVIVEHGHPDVPGTFIHPVSAPTVIAGNGTIGLEILEDLPDVDSVLVPYGGGGLSCGIASAIKALRPEVRIHPCEVETAAPLSASLAAGRPVAIDRKPSFVDGIGGKSVLEEMWHLAQAVLEEPVVVSVEAIVDALHLLLTRNRLVAEGAAGSSVAAALAGRGGGGKVVCVVSGGNLSRSALTAILEGKIPEAH